MVYTRVTYIRTRKKICAIPSFLPPIEEIAGKFKIMLYFAVTEMCFVFTFKFAAPLYHKIITLNYNYFILPTQIYLDILMLTNNLTGKGCMI